MARRRNGNGIRRSGEPNPSMTSGRVFDASKPRPFFDIIHPDWHAYELEKRKWRYTYEGGERYIEFFLRKFKREKWQEWYERKFLTFCPPNAKEAVNEILNAIFQRLSDVTRVGPQSYIDACKGLNGGVDKAGTTMTAFLGEEILPEMLPMKEVGVWVDMPPVPAEATKADVDGVQPYFYVYPTEAIRSWAYDDDNCLIAVMLREIQHPLDPDTGLPTSDGDKEYYRYAKRILVDGVNKVEVTVQDDKGTQISKEILNIPEIPFEIAEIKHSLLEDVADMQKSLLNMESADVYWCVKAGFPIFTEQFDPRTAGINIRPAQQAPKSPGYPNVIGPAPTSIPNDPIPSGQAKQAEDARNEEVTLGVTSGRRYGKDLERPGFIHPSSEPLQATMAKEMQIKEDIRRAVHLSVATLDPRMASAESKQMDDQGLQNGLLAIGMALERFERRLAHIWSLYMGEQEATIRYPEQWTVQGDAGRREDAQALCELKDQIPSLTAAKEILKQAADRLVGHRVAPEVLDKIHQEIDAAKCLTFNIDDLQKEIELGIVSAETASQNRGYPEAEHENALNEKAETLKIMAISQTAGIGAAADPARGGVGPPGDKKSKNEKALDANKTGAPSDNTRGDGK